MRVYQFRHLGIACMLWACQNSNFAVTSRKVRSIARFFKKWKCPLSKQTKNSSKPEIIAGAIDLPPDFDPEVPSREAIMQQLRTFGKPMSLEALARALGAPVPLSVGFARRLRAMERDGPLFADPRGKVMVNPHL